MKKFAFKILSIMLAIALLVIALPVVVYAEDVSPCANAPCTHAQPKYRIVEAYLYVTNEEHLLTLYLFKTCARCDKVLDYAEMDSMMEPHTIDPSVDQETEMQGPCVHCGGMIYW